MAALKTVSVAADSVAWCDGATLNKLMYGPPATHVPMHGPCTYIPSGGRALRAHQSYKRNLKKKLHGQKLSLEDEVVEDEYTNSTDIGPSSVSPRHTPSKAKM